MSPKICKSNIVLISFFYACYLKSKELYLIEMKNKGLDENILGIQIWTKITWYFTQMTISFLNKLLREVNLFQDVNNLSENIEYRIIYVFSLWTNITSEFGYLCYFPYSTSPSDWNSIGTCNIKVGK